MNHTENNEVDEIPETHTTRRGVALYPENPFMAEVKTRSRRITNRRGDMMLVNTESGEVAAPIAGFWESEVVDATQFVKLFVNGVKALKELTSAGTKVFEILYYKVQDAIGKDSVYLSFTGIKQQITPISMSTYKRGLAELIDKKFLAATPEQGRFWLNPDFVFNGDRLAFVKAYRKAPENPAEDTKTIDMFKPS